MKFYAIQLGCTKVLKATNTEEVVTIVTFSENSTTKSNNALMKIASSLSLEGEYETIRANDPDLTKVGETLEENQFWSHHTYHYLVKLSKFKELKEILELVFPRKYYIQLSIDGKSTTL